MPQNNDLPKADLVLEDDLPYITLDASLPFVNEGSLQIKMMQCNITQGTYVVRTRFAPGTTIQRHHHTGEIYAFTTSGSWYYLEYPDDINVAGAYLYEPAGSVHTLHVPAGNTEDTEIDFVMNGANLNLNDDDTIDSILDAKVMLDVYTQMCDAMGVDVRGQIIGL